MANPFQIGSTVYTGAGSSRILNVTNPTSSGDSILVLVVVNNTTCTVSACTDTKGNVYTLDKSFTTTQPTLYAFSSAGATGGAGGGATAALTVADSFTVTTAAVSGNVDLYAVSVPLVGTIDQIASVATGASTTPSVSATPTANNETVVSLWGTANAGGAPAVNSPFTDLVSVHTGTNPYADAAYDVLVGGSGSAQTSTLTIVSAAWRGVMYTFRPGGPSAALVTAQETISALAPTLTVGAVSQALSVASVAVSAPAPGATVSAIISLPVARVTMAAPAFATPVPTITVVLPTAAVESVKALQPYVFAGPQLFVMGSTPHT